MGNKQSAAGRGASASKPVKDKDAAGAVAAPAAPSSGVAPDETDIGIPPALMDFADGNSGRHRVSIADFELLKVIGKGSFGKVFLVAKRAGKDRGSVYAMKTLRKEVLLRRHQVEHTKHERLILEAVHHPFIVKLVYAFQTIDKLYLITDFASGGELFYWLRRQRVVSQAAARLYAAELVLALEHLHSMDIVYRDLKPENILLDADGHVKLTDFGLSKTSVKGFGAEDGTRTFCGTPEYLAPEVLEATGHGKAVDWWSLGTLLYEMIAGLPPFYDTNTEAMYEKILTAELRWPRHFLPETVSLLHGMLTRRVEDRLGYRGAGEIKAHPFFAGLDWDAVYHRRIKPAFVPPHNGPGSAALDAAGGVDAAAAAGHHSSAGAGAGGAALPVGGVPGVGVNVSNFESEFTSETPVDSMDERSRLSSTAAERAHFEGFTYVGPSALGAGGMVASHGEDGLGYGLGPARADSFGGPGGRAESFCAVSPPTAAPSALAATSSGRRLAGH